ncbi:MAG: CPBP family intramembrane glutamic endopeptidase [Sedimentisphaerales bacterium]|nr:CPBP family intramembrane glutamic endopeptidase [Sedimentisphaerales bacterium]
MIEGREKLSIAGILLLIELLCVTVVTIILIRLLRNNVNHRGDWIFTPFLLITAALVPTRLRKRSFAEIGLRVGRPGLILQALCITCAIVFPLLLAGIFVLKQLNLQLPLSPIIPDGRWLSWVAYQFMYVAVAEEIFFRGYFQCNVLSLLTMSVQKSRVFLEIIAIIASATVFAISHCLILGSVMPIITFLPGVIFGWLLVKTKSLLAPVLFHGLANVFYGLIAAVLT